MDGFTFPIQVSRTARKKSASIELEGHLVKVTVPQSLSETRVRELISKRSGWIQSKLKEQSKQPILKSKEYVSGETFPYLGKNYRLKVHEGIVSSVKLKNGYLNVYVSDEQKDDATIRCLLEEWYRRHAQTRLTEKTERLAKMIGVAPSSIEVKSFKSRWGSCSSNGSISYNWKIVLAHHRIIDYVVVHELCHLIEHNHSSRYWKEVGKYIPDWRARREWLKFNPPIF